MGSLHRRSVMELRLTSSQDTAELFFEDMRLPGSAILGGEDGLNRGFQFLMHDLGRERLFFIEKYRI